MLIFSPNTDIALNNISLTDESGNNIVGATSVFWSVLDEAGTIIFPEVSLTPFTNGSTFVNIVVPASANAVTKISTRTLRIRVVAPAGTYLINAYYSLRPIFELEKFKNSFQTYPEAISTSHEIQMEENPHWMNSTEIDRKNSLAAAFRKIISYQFTIPKPDDSQSYITDYISDYYGDDRVILPDHWKTMTLSAWDSLNDRFKGALRRAQVLEAASIMSGDIQKDRRRLGLFSETIGESSMMFRPGKPLEFGICNAALIELDGFISYKVRVAR